VEQRKILVGYVLTSTLRKLVLETLAKRGVLRQTQLARAIKKRQQNVSVVLRELERNGLVECLTPNKKAWKAYELTQLGKEVLREAKRLTKAGF